MRRGHRIPPAAPVALATIAGLLTAPVGVPSAAQSTGGVAATITVVEGQAEVVRRGATAAVPARADMRVLPGSTVRTKPNGRVELQFDDHSLLRLDHNTEITILEGEAPRGVLVTLGKLWAKVQTVLGTSKFQIKTPTVVAGVRGTILRAEVSEEEAAIAVDEGEVEVDSGNGEPAVLLGPNEEVRARRGKRGLERHGFDPEGRAKWEFWTDPLVQQELQSIHESAIEAKQAAVKVQQKVKDIFQALAVDGEAVTRVAQRVRIANANVAFVQRALSTPPPAPGGPRGRRGGPARPGMRRPPTKAQLLAALDQADAIYTQTLPLIPRGRDAVRQHFADVDGLRNALQAHRQAQAELMGKLKAFRERREVDPHWQQFRKHCEESQASGQEADRALGECNHLLKPDLPDKLGDDPKLMLTIQHRFVWASRTLDALEQQIAQGQEQARRLRAAL